MLGGRGGGRHHRGIGAILEGLKVSKSKRSKTDLGEEGTAEEMNTRKGGGGGFQILVSNRCQVALL